MKQVIITNHRLDEGQEDLVRQIVTNYTGCTLNRFESNGGEFEASCEVQNEGQLEQIRSELSKLSKTLSVRIQLIPVHEL